MSIKTLKITLRSPQLFFDKNSLIYFIAAYYLNTQKFIKFKILSSICWSYKNSFATSNIKILFFKRFKKLNFCSHILKRFKIISVRNNFKKYIKTC